MISFEIDDAAAVARIKDASMDLVKQGIRSIHGSVEHVRPGIRSFRLIKLGLFARLEFRLKNSQRSRYLFVLQQQQQEATLAREHTRGPHDMVHIFSYGTRIETIMHPSKAH